MGESFLGLPNRFKIIDNLLESTYNPNHALSAYQGYRIWDNFNNYIKVSGGSLTGTLGVKDVIPSATKTYNIGSYGSEFKEVYAEKFFGIFYGNSTSSNKWNSPMTLELTGSVTGSVIFDGSNKATLNVVTNHEHEQYLKLAGGALSGNIKLSKSSAIVNHYDSIVLNSTSDESLQLGYGPYYVEKGATEIYSSGDVIFRTKSSGASITSDLHKKTVNVGTSDNSVYISNVTGNDFLYITDDHNIKFNNNDVYHHGNFKPEDLLYVDYKTHINEVKKVVKVIAILVDELEVRMGVKDNRDYPEASITDQLEYYKQNAIKILDS